MLNLITITTMMIMMMRISPPPTRAYVYTFLQYKFERETVLFFHVSPRHNLLFFTATTDVSPQRVQSVKREPMNRCFLPLHCHKD